MQENLIISATDGYPLSVTVFTPKKSTGRVVLINSATGVKQKYYHDFAIFLSDQGYHVYTYDYRGIGNSRPKKLRGFKASMEEWGTKDYHSMMQYISIAHPQSGIIIIGHSVGGQIIGMTNLSQYADALITIGAQTPHIDNFKGLRLTVKLIFFWYILIPFFTRLSGYFPAKALGLFEDLPSGVARQWARWAKNKNYLFDELPSLSEKFKSLTLPALMISFSDDDFAPKPAVHNLMNFYTGIKWSHWHIQPEDVLHDKVGHFGFFKKRMQSVLWNEVLTWIGKPMKLKETKAA